ncbi:hypothetical protein SNARM312S_08363 [Streptomyces narbonensis]
MKDAAAAVSGSASPAGSRSRRSVAVALPISSWTLRTDEVYASRS